MRVMTFNIRFASPEDGVNAWQFRQELVARVIKRYAPAFLGTQEGMWDQLCSLQQHLPEYALHVPDRVIDDTCQYPTLFYAEKGFEVTEGGEFWLSKTPAIHRSKDWDSAFPRMMSYGFFWDRDTEKQFLVVVTHLDHKGSEARWNQAKLIGEFLQQHDGPAIVMGDFNDEPGSPVHQLLVSSAFGLQDTWTMLGRNEDEQSMTHHGFKGIPQKTRMDWILVTKHFRVMDALIIRDNTEGRYPSDHFPYLADLEWR
jgi:endonuclease/exonuclease/phosphatase family metal-dependent hydrolase